MGALGGMRRNVEVKARLRARAEALGAALRLLGRDGHGWQRPRECPGHPQGTAGGREPLPVCPGEGRGTAWGGGEGREVIGEGKEVPQECPREGKVPPVCHREGQEVPPECPGPGQVLFQTDTFFRVPRGRLKLRRTQDGRGELIFYDRPDTSGPKLSSFTITPTADPDGLEAVLAQSLGVLGTVTKERLLLLLGQTRVHLDRVQGLGDFLELEVVLRPEQSVEEGQRLAQELLRELGIGDGDLVTGAYLDLLLARGQAGTAGDSARCHPQGRQGQVGTAGDRDSAQCHP